MPIYAYQCSACGAEHDVLQKVSDPPLSVCPACHQPSLSKKVTAAGFQLKGSGWYVTDFRDKGAKKDARAKTDAPADAPANGSGAAAGDAAPGATPPPAGGAASPPAATAAVPAAPATATKPTTNGPSPAS